MSVRVDSAGPVLDRVREDHGLSLAAAESAWWDGHQHRYGVSARQGYRAGWWAAVEWVLRTQAAMDDLTVGQMLAELRKGPGSVFWPLLADDPKFWADCPGCRMPVLIDVRGLCDTCAHEFEEEK